MAQTAALIDALKRVLRAKGVTYAKLAKGLKLSEASVKRIFADRSFTLERLDRICEQEKELVSDPKLLLVAVHALNHWSLEEIIETYALSKAECIRLLARLDRL